MAKLFKNQNKKVLKRVVLILVFIGLTILSLFIGVDKSVTLKSLINLDAKAWITFSSSRFPRTAAIILTGMGLSVAGLIMQAISRNKFMSPSTSGTTDAAALGVLISYVFLGKQSDGIKTVFAFIFALIATLIFMQILRKIKLKEAVYVPLMGLMFGGIVSAVTQALAYHYNVVQILSQISLGTFNRFTDFNLLYLLIIPLVLASIYATRLSIAGLGEDFSQGLGLNYQRIIFIGLCLIASISAATFVTVGPISFVGLIIPNLVTAYYGDNIKRSIFDVSILGASFILICDIFSRLIIFPYEVAISFTIGIVGGIIFLFILLRRLYYA